MIPLSEVHFTKDIITFEITPKDTDSVGEKYSLNVPVGLISTPSNVNITPSSPVGGVDDLLCIRCNCGSDATDGEDVLVTPRLG